MTLEVVTFWALSILLVGSALAVVLTKNLFHSVLGLLDVQTHVYKPERDIFEGCRGGAGSAFAAM